MNLFEIDAAIMAAFDAAVDQDTGEILDEEALKAFDQLNVDRSTKIENIACWIRNLESDANELKEQKMIFATRQAAAERKRDSLKRYLTQVMAGEKFETPRVSIRWRKSEGVEIDDEASFVNQIETTDLADELLTYQAPKINKTAVKDALKQGLSLPGARLETRQNIQIK